MKGQAGRVSFDALVELLVALFIVPPLVCCAIQAVALVLAAVLPWLVIAAIVFGAAACLAVGLSSRHREHTHLEDDMPVRVLPVRRPPGIPDRRAERRDH